VLVATLSQYVNQNGEMPKINIKTLKKSIDIKAT